MRKKFYFRNLFLIIALALLVSCNADILINNGEIGLPDSNGVTGGITEDVELTAPRRVNATKSIYPDSINITWSPVPGADYYTIEKTSHEVERLSGSEQWVPVQESIIGTTGYRDYSSLEPSTYYSYRVTAHTFEGESSPVSDVSTGTILASPQSISVSQGESESEIYITWTQMPYVDSYKIYMSSTDTISGVESEVQATVSSRNGSENGFAYQIDPNREAGKELSFGIQGVGESGETAAISLPRVGYTRVPGAPVQPQYSNTEEGISKGSSLTGITIRFSSQARSDDIDFIIKKSSPGSAEETILDTSLSESEKDKLVVNENGEYEFTDTVVARNVLYTYSVIAKNDTGMSQAAVATGYLLSPVTNLTLTPVNTEEKFGYELSFKLPVGWDDTERTTKYIYEVEETNKNGDVVSNKDYSEAEINDLISSFYNFDKEVTEEKELTELQKISITVRTDDGMETNTVTSNTIPFIPEAITSMEATSNDRPIEGEKPNENGVYPVHVSWETASTSDTFTLFRKDQDGNTARYNVSGRSYVDESTQPLVIYEYWIEARDELGRTYGEAHAEDSYGSVTLQVYKDIFESVSLKPWDKQGYVPSEYRSWWKNTEVAKKIAYGNSSNLTTQMDALGSASANDHYRNGRINYNAEMNGIGAIIRFTYTNFGENLNFWMNGDYSMDVDTSGSGSASSGSGGFSIEGMYPGHIGIGNIRVSGKNFAGQYTVTYKYSDGSEVTGEVGA